MIYMTSVFPSNKHSFWHHDCSSVTCRLKKQEYPHSGRGKKNFPDSMECMIQTAGKLVKRAKIMIQTSIRQKYYIIHYDTVKI
jgi:hypothetical protein